MFFTQEILLYILKQYQYLINISLYDDKSLRYYDNENFILEIPKLITTSFGKDEYIFNHTSVTRAKDIGMIRRRYKNNYNDLINIALVNKSFYKYLYLNIFNFLIVYNKKDKYDEKKKYNVHFKKIFHKFKWMKIGDINNEYIFTINENQLVYFEALYNNFKTMKTEDLSCKITKETIKEFIVPKIFSFYPFSNFSLINLVNLVDKKGIYKDYQYMIQIEEHKNHNYIEIVSLEERVVVRKIYGSFNYCYLHFNNFGKREVDYFINSRSPFYFYFFGDFIFNLLSKLKDSDIEKFLK